MPVSSCIVGRLVREKNCTPPPSRRCCIWIRRKVANKIRCTVEKKWTCSPQNWCRNSRNGRDCHHTLEETNMANADVENSDFNRCSSALDIWVMEIKHEERIGKNWNMGGGGEGAVSAWQMMERMIRRPCRNNCHAPLPEGRCPSDSWAWCLFSVECLLRRSNDFPKCLGWLTEDTESVYANLNQTGCHGWSENFPRCQSKLMLCMDLTTGSSFKLNILSSETLSNYSWRRNSLKNPTPPPASTWLLKPQPIRTTNQALAGAESGSSTSFSASCRFEVNISPTKTEIPNYRTHVKTCALLVMARNHIATYVLRSGEKMEKCCPFGTRNLKIQLLS